MGDVLATRVVGTPIGELRLAATAAGLVRIALPTGSGAGFRGWLNVHVPDADPIATTPALDEASAELQAYFAGSLREFKVPLDLRGTEFQTRVWRALATIPFGQTWSYAELAKRVGSPKGFRAVGAANGANPLAIVLPCHRVIASDGGLGGYAGGLECKRRLLAFEKGRADPSRLL